MAQSRADDAPVPAFVGSGPKGTLTEKDARQLLAEHARSGLTLPDFARRKGLAPHRLFWWRTKLARQPVPAAAPGATATFVPVVVTPAPAPAAPFELVLANERTVRVPQDFQAEALARLLAVLTGAR